MQQYTQKTTIEEFLSAAAAKQPTPGGGSVAALVGALAASMGEMVLNYSVGKKELAIHKAQLELALTEFSRARAMMVEFMLEDQAAFDALTLARKGQSKQTVVTALQTCIRVPQAMGATAVAVLELCDRMVDVVNHYLLSDLAVCADLAMATLRCALYNVRVNISELPEASDRSRIEGEIGQLLTRGAMLIQRVSPRIWLRHSGGQMK